MTAPGTAPKNHYIIKTQNGPGHMRDLSRRPNTDEEDLDDFDDDLLDDDEDEDDDLDDDEELEDLLDEAFDDDDEE